MQVDHEDGMTWVFRLMAMGVGGVSSLFALFISPPETHREGMIRFAAGCVVAFACTGMTLQLLHITVNTDTVLAGGLVWGSIGWFVLGGLVTWGKSGGPLSYLARLVQGQQDKNRIQQYDNARQEASNISQEIRNVRQQQKKNEG